MPEETKLNDLPEAGTQGVPNLMDDPAADEANICIACQ